MYVNGAVQVNGNVKMGDIPINRTISAISTFTSNATFSIPANATLNSAEMLLLGAGGGGNNADSTFSGAGLYSAGGGGGAGGYVYVSNVVANITPGVEHTIVVSNKTNAGMNGANSTALGYTAIGGGRGGAGVVENPAGRAGANGGSGGGGAVYDTVNSNVGGVGVSGQGYNGRAGANSSVIGTLIYGGGGGGAGANATSSIGLGGAGLVSSITGASVTYCQGGNGAKNSSSTAGRANGTPISRLSFGSGGAGCYLQKPSGTPGSTTEWDGNGRGGYCVIKYTYTIN